MPLLVILMMFVTEPGSLQDAFCLNVTTCEIFNIIIIIIYKMETQHVNVSIFNCDIIELPCPNSFITIILMYTGINV